MSTATKPDRIEKTYPTEAEAKRKRRQAIDLGFAVSLIAYDPSRDRYVYDLLP